MIVKEDNVTLERIMKTFVACQLISIPAVHYIYMILIISFKMLNKAVC